MKMWLLLAALPAALSAQQPADSAHAISLQEAIALATKNQPAAVAAKNQITTAHAAVTSAYANFIPSLSWSMGQNQSSGPRLGQEGNIIQYQTPWSYSDGLRASVTVFDGGQRFATLRSAKAGVLSAEANQVAQQFGIALNVKTQYYNILAAMESESAARAQLAQAEEQLKVSDAKLAAGAATRADSLQSAVQVGNAQVALLTAQNNRKVADAALTRLVGSQTLVTATAADTAEPAITPIDSVLLAHLAAQGPGVRSAQASLASAQATYSASRSSYLPTISLSYSRSGNGYDKYFGIGGGSLSYSKTLSISLSYSLFDNWTREAQSSVAAAGVSNAQATLRDAEAGAQQSLVQYVASLETLEQQLRIQQASIAAAQENLRVEQQRYAVGAATILDVLTAQTTINQAVAQLIQYRLNFRTTRAQIEQLIGRSLQ